MYSDLVEFKGQSRIISTAGGGIVLFFTTLNETWVKIRVSFGKGKAAQCGETFQYMSQKLPC